MSIALVTLTKQDARLLTDEVKADAAALWSKLLALYEGGAHTVLGYKSWHAYCAAEFDMGQSRAYQLLDAGRVLEQLDSTTVESPASESVARELAQLLREAPEQIVATWELAVAQFGQPTAIQVREVASRKNAQIGSALGGFDDFDSDDLEEEIADAEIVVDDDPKLRRIMQNVANVLALLRLAETLDDVSALDRRREASLLLSTTARTLSEIVR